MIKRGKLSILKSLKMLLISMNLNVNFTETLWWMYPFQLCSQLRLIPSAYLDFKQALINECEKHGGLKLAQARQLIKIDVNKTRKIYDFLVAEGSVKRESSWCIVGYIYVMHCMFYC